MNYYKLVIWENPMNKTELGIFSETYCREYFKKYANKKDFHISCIKVNKPS